MNRRLPVLSAIALMIIAITAWQLWSMKHRHRLGPPGLRLSSEPIFGEDGRMARTNSVYLPWLAGAWTGSNMPITNLELGYLPADTTYARKGYRTGDGDSRWALQASVVMMGTDRTSIHRPEYCLTGQGWAIERRQNTTVKVPGLVAGSLPVRRFDAVQSGSINGKPSLIKGVYVFWFVADGLVTADYRQRLLWMARNLLTTGELQRWAYVSCFTTCLPGREDEAFAKISDWIAAAAPEFHTLRSTPASGPIPVSPVSH